MASRELAIVELGRFIVTETVVFEAIARIYCVGADWSDERMHLSGCFEEQDTSVHQIVKMKAEQTCISNEAAAPDHMIAEWMHGISLHYGVC